MGFSAAALPHQLAPARGSVGAGPRHRLLPATGARQLSARSARSSTRTMLAVCSADAQVEAPPSARKEGLALLLDDGTRKSHSVAENTAFVTGFFKGIATKDGFAKLVASLYFVYKAMEDAFDSTDDKNVKALDYQSLRRLRSLEVDMEYYFGADWRNTVKPSAATQKYVARIHTVVQDAPTLLIAHQYTRYLGDLFGGQMMGGMATRSLGLEEGKGIEFYQFPDIADNKQFIEEWYTALNKLELSDATKQEIVDEANLVFAYNIELFSELDGSAFQAMVALVWSNLKEKLGL